MTLQPGSSGIVARFGGGLAAALLLITPVHFAYAQSNDGGLTQRVEALEQQLVEMQVTMGTLESLARGRPSSGGSYQAAAATANSADTARLEAEVQSLRNQVTALTRQVQALSGGQLSNAGSLQNNSFQNESFAQPLDTTTPVGGEIGGFGTMTVTNEKQGGQDQIGSIIQNNTLGQPSQQVTSIGALPPGQEYQRAYGYLLEQNYGAAEAAFGDFVKKHPNDKLAGNAQYWLGESHYVRGNYREAATAFLKGYRAYGKSPKAPDSLLKLAMSLSRLGQKPSACATFQELNARFPNAPQHVKQSSQAEWKRAGC